MSDEGGEVAYATKEDNYYEYPSRARKGGSTFKATCTRFLTLIATLVMLALCAVSLLFYQTLPVGQYQDLDSVSMLYDHRKAAKGIDTQHNKFRTEVWERDVVVSSLQDEVYEVSKYIPVALYCESPSLCLVDFEVQCLSNLRAVNVTHSLTSSQDRLVKSMQFYSSCSEFNALSWQEKAARIQVLYHGINGVYPTLDSSQETTWNQWVCVNWNQLQTVTTPCTRKIDLCAPTSASLSSIKSSPSVLDFFRIARSPACGGGPRIEVHHKLGTISTLNLADRDYGWVFVEEVESFFSESFSQAFGQGVTEPYSRTSISSMLLVGGRTVSFSFATKSGGNMKTEKYIGALAAQVSIEAVPGTCPDTGHNIFYGSGSVDVLIGAFNLSAVSMIPVSIGESIKYLPQYEVTADNDWTSLSVRRISGIEIKVAKSSISQQHTWRVVEVVGKYDGVTLSEETVEVQIELHDVSEPIALQLPMLEMEYYTLAALALAFVAGVIFLFLPFILYHEYKETLVANGLPLPFFRYTTQFRGW